MPQQKSAKLVISRARALVLVFLVLAITSGLAVVAHADKFDEQINSLKAQNNDAKNLVNGLAAQAGSYKGAIDQLQAQIGTIQAALSANQVKQTSLQGEITANQAKIDQHKQYLGKDIKAMYIDGQLSTIEELATSKNLSDYVDREEYRTGVQNKIDTTIKQIAALQSQLKQQKSDLDVLVNSQKQQNEQLASARYQQQQLLAYNQGEQVAYNQQIQANSGKIADLKKQQVAANSRFISGSSSSGGNLGGAAGSGPACGGGYPGSASGPIGPWGCNYPQDCGHLDSWGMCNRECVSYTAFKVAASGRYMPYWGGRGNANQWDDNARAAGIPVDSNPQAGDVAISNYGYYGHAMYVESVNSNGTINISQYNAAGNGRYSTNTVSVGGLSFIHF